MGHHGVRAFHMEAEGKSNILVVDDLPEKILILETILQDLGQNVVAARSGREALRRLLEQDFAVILLDVNMPDINGFETAALVRQRKRSAHTPIIFITAFNDEMHAAQGYKLGAVDYIQSPVIPEVLRTKVRVFVELYQKSEQVKRQAEERIALAREQAARAAAEETTRRSTFLAEASTVLVRSLDFDATHRALARQPVPFLGDLSAATLVDEQTGAWKTELAWTTAAMNPIIQTFVAGVGLPAQLARAVERVLDSGQSEFLLDISATAQKEPATSSEWGQGEPWPDWEARSAVVLPLQARGLMLGALTLVLGPSGRRYTSSDLAVAQDLAGRAAIALDNARLYRNIQEGDRRKNEFLAMLAHELRNPLAPIRNAVQLLRLLGQNDAQLIWARDVIERQVQHLVRLVDDLLDISRITSGKVQIRTEPVDVRVVTARAVETSRPLIDARKHELTVTVPHEPILAEADPTRLAQVVANLLNNAAKYTEEGGRIWLTLEQETGEVVVRVRDNGIGIPAEMLSSIFDLFTQADRSLDRSQGGLGIGLTLVRRLVEMHGGSVHASSAGPNQGSEFVVRLPALTGAALPTAPVEVSQNGAKAVSPSRILIVDDNRDAAESLALLLQVTGFDVLQAHDGPAAVKAVEAFRPRMVLLDIGLPGMNGYDVARAIRDNHQTDDILLVALTGYGQEEDRQRSRAAGFDCHLVKPVDPEALAGLFASLSTKDGEVAVSANWRR
jgi:signal transduction histidine kinase/DNA-binding response OmpR family regulator